MKRLVFLVGLVFGIAATFGSPSAPQPLSQNPEYAHYDVQTHNRDTMNGSWDAPVAAEHGANCSGPPATHTVSTFLDSVFVCNDHVMTTLNAPGYGMIALTPSQTVNCSTGCTVQWEMSTEKLSNRDWIDVWLTPWRDNLTLPIDAGHAGVDLQGPPRSGLHVMLNDANNWNAYSVVNYTENDLGACWWCDPIGFGIAAGTNQAAVRQTFKLTVTPGHIRLERLASATATGYVWLDGACSCLLSPDYVVTFGHHSYNPTKDGGQPGTWHWSNFTFSNAAPFTLIHSPVALANAANPVVNFASPAPANAYLRFSGMCQVKVDGVVAQKQAFAGLHYDTAASYFMPIAQGKQSVTISFGQDNWIGPSNFNCYARDFAVWSKTGGTLSTPTPQPQPSPTLTATPTTVPVATATSTSQPPATPTAIVTATPTQTAVPITSTMTPSATPSPSPVCREAYYLNNVLTQGPVRVCP